MSRSLSDWGARWFASSPKRLVGGAEVLHLTFPDDVPLRGGAAERAYARQLFVHYLGIQAAEWPLSVWRYGRTRGASIWSTNAASHDANIAEPGPAGQLSSMPTAALVWPLALRWALHQRPDMASMPTCLVLVEGYSYLVVRLSPERIESLEPGWLPAADFASLAEALVALKASEPVRVVVGYGVSGSPTGLGGYAVLGDLTNSVVPPAWLRGGRWASGRSSGPLASALCADGEEPASRWLANAALVCSMLVLAATARDAWHRNQQTRLNIQLALPKMQATASPPVNSLGQLNAQRELAEAARLIHLPWPTALGGVEAAAAPGVHWLELTHNAEQPGQWLVRAKAPDVPTALATADALTRQSGWLSARVTRLEPPRPADSSVVFTMEASHLEVRR